MSSPAPRRSQRNSASATPMRSTRNSQQLRSSPVVPDRSGDQGTPSMTPGQSRRQETPRASRQPVLSSSPLFFRSSPVNETGGANGTRNERMDISSPLRQTSLANSTPRQQLQAPGGISMVFPYNFCNLLQLIQVHRFFSDSLRSKFQPSSSCEWQCSRAGKYTDKH